VRPPYPLVLLGQIDKLGGLAQVPPLQTQRRKLLHLFGCSSSTCRSSVCTHPFNVFSLESSLLLGEGGRVGGTYIICCCLHSRVYCVAASPRCPWSQRGR
jgi:hypothetical protein